MKNRTKLTPLMLAVGLALSVMSISIGAAHAQAIVSTEAGNGSVVLSNTSDTADQAPAALDPAAGVAGADTTAATAEAEPPKDPREQYRDLVLQVPEELPAGTTAVSRRYRKVDLATYRAMMQNNTPKPDH
jgi:hypothetical protein